MSKETAAAILTKLYFEKVPNVEKKLAGPNPREDHAAAVEQIGTIYGLFLSKLDMFLVWGRTARQGAAVISI